MRYPDARRLDLIDDLHGHSVADPYRWLEDAAADETEQWSRAQDELARSVLASSPGRDRLAARLRELTPGVITAPNMIGDRSFFYRRQPDQEFMVVCVQDGPEGEVRELLDVARLDPSLTTVLDSASASKEGDRLAYLTSEKGREESTLRVLDVASGQDVAPPVALGRGAQVTWLPGGEELIVVRRLADVPEDEPQFHRRVWRHRIGTDPSEDVMLFGEGRDKRTYYGVSTSLDGRWLVIVAAIGTEPRNDAYLVDLAGSGEPAVVAEGLDARVYPRISFDGRMYVFTDLDAPRYRFCTADPMRPGVESWQDVLPQTEDVLSSVGVTADALVAVREHDVVSQVTVHDRETGAPRSGLPLPGLGMATVTVRAEGGHDAWVRYTDFVTPPTILHTRLDGAIGDVSVWATPPGAVEVSGVKATQVFFESKDGTRVPMFVIAPEGVPMDGTTPAILYGYGGFDVSLSPEYSNSVASWAEAGGVYAIANLRGGSEYGQDWHRAGMRGSKQNVFDDFITAAEWLVESGYTAAHRLAISGGSNGGLLVGAALTQRPELFRAVACSAPLLDMVRYELFGLGATWNDEYGRASEAEEFEWLISYSPYHHVRSGVEYPAVLFTVFEGDTRVDPLHARKLCAALQHATTADMAERPIILRRETDVGHGERALSLRIGLQADTQAFLASQVGLALPS
jgi:prolyl oligopeptidase